MDPGAALAITLGLSAVLALIPASIGSRKGRSWFGFWLFGFLFFIPALIVALIMKDEGQLSNYNALRRQPHWGAPPPAHTAPAPAATTTRVEELEKLVALRDSGALTPEEYETMKVRLLAP